MPGFGALRLAALNRDPEFEVQDHVAAGDAAEAVENLAAQAKELALPDSIFDFDDEGSADEREPARVGGDGFADSGGPNGAGEIFFAEDFFRKLVVLNETGGAFHETCRQTCASGGERGE